MSVNAFQLKVGNRSPAIRYALDPADTVLAGATIRFVMSDFSGIRKVDSAATIFSTSPAVLQYNWVALDVDTEGVFKAKFEITYADGTKEDFPNSGFIPIIIERSL